MSELTLAAIENAIKTSARTVGSCLSTIKSMSNASPDVSDMSSRLVAVETCIQSLAIQVTYERRTQGFLDIWSEPAKCVLVALRDILLQIRERLGEKPAKLKFWSKTAWPFENHETQVLRLHLGAYTSLVVTVFDSHKQTSIPAVQMLSRQLEEIKSRFGDLNLSAIDRPTDASVKSESSMQLQDMGPPKIEDQSNESAPAEWTTWKEHVFKVISFRRRTNPFESRESEDFGPGTVAIRYARNGSGLWIFFYPEAMETFESRWYSKVCEQWAEMNREQDHRFRVHQWNNYDERKDPAISLMIGMGDYVPDTPPEYGQISSGVNTLLLQFSSQRKVESCWAAFCEMWAQCGRNWERQIRVLKAEQRRRKEQQQTDEEAIPEVQSHGRRGAEQEQRHEEHQHRAEEEELPAYSPAEGTTGDIEIATMAESSAAQHSADTR